jgi:prephenate dehydratase
MSASDSVPLSAPRVAFQGAPGAFGEEAVRRWRGDAHPRPCATFADVVDAVRTGAADAGVLPVHNRIAGPVLAARAVLDAHADALQLTGEVAVRVALCVLARPGTALTDLRVVRSHPVALAQCGAFLAAHPAITAEPWWDTAGAARDLAAGGDAHVGALASRLAAERWGLQLLATDVQDAVDNWTRFVVIGAR